jgi:hypothetical protein
MERLSANVLLCLFAGQVSSVAISLKPETLHFGLDGSAGAPGGFYKQLRNSQGEKNVPSAVTIGWRQLPSRVIDISGLAGDMQRLLAASQFTSAQFARQMIEGTPKIVFTKQEH